MKTTSNPPALFTHAARPPLINDGAKDQRYFGGMYAFRKKYNGSILDATVLRVADEHFARLHVDTQIPGVGTVRLKAHLTADECRLLACALLDAEHDLRTASTEIAKAGAA